MQAEQQTTTQTKKTTKGGKKNTKNVTEEVQVQEQQTVVEKTPVITIQVQQPIVENTPVVNEQENNNNENDTETEIEYQTIVDYVNTTSDKFNEFSKLFKEKSPTKDERGKIEASFKKFHKNYSNFQAGYYEYLSREVSNLEKKSGNKSSTKKLADKDKAAIHKKLKVQKFLLDFMKLPADTLVSRSDALTAITGYVKEEKAKNPDIIVENDKKSFKIMGDLQGLFNGIHGVMVSKGLTDETPKQIKYTQIMSYMTHCFIKDEVA
jgi:hypothetical protein